VAHATGGILRALILCTAGVDIGDTPSSLGTTSTRVFASAEKVFTEHSSEKHGKPLLLLLSRHTYTWISKEVGRARAYRSSKSWSRSAALTTHV
jgi:hypothetical protein